MKRIVLAAGIFAATAALAQPTVITDPAVAPSGSYRVEPNHTQVIFTILHLGISPYFGSFGKASGTLKYDAKNPEKSRVTVDVDMTSANTPSEKLRNELLSAAVFHTDRFPKATFKSTDIRRTGPNTGDITGDLTLHGVTRPVTLRTRFHGMTEANNGAARLGFSATAELKRSDFDLVVMRWAPMVSDAVTLLIEAEFIQEKK
ncbi:MAG: YceI family protein [Alphaproteobacteria bacterium]